MVLPSQADLQAGKGRIFFSLFVLILFNIGESKAQHYGTAAGSSENGSLIPKKSTKANNFEALISLSPVLQDILIHQTHPDSIPYEVSPTFGRRLLALPSDVFHLAILPVKWTTIWIEEKEVDQKLIDFFLSDDRSSGFYPNVSIGGRTDFAGGITYFDRDVFNRQHSLDFNVFYSGRTNLNAGLNYLIPPSVLRRYQINISAKMRSDDHENFFLGGNDGAKDSQFLYKIEEYKLQTEFGYLLLPNFFATVTGGIRHIAVYGSSNKILEAEEIPLSDETPGYGLNTLFNSGISLTYDLRKSFYVNSNTNLLSRIATNWDFKQTKVGVYSGPLFDLGLSYFKHIGGNDYNFLKYYGEWQQFFPLPGLPENRRFAFRARLEKRYPLGDSTVPFFEESLLADADNLRGYAQDRFRDLGSLLFTLEYRYPIWDTWDAVIFTDQGQVFSKYSELSLNDFHGSIGTGFRFMTASDFLFRFEIGFSKETTRSLLSFTMNF